MPGAILQLSAYGPQDKILTGNPQITYFVSIYKRHTNFAIQFIELLFNGQIDFGKKVYCNIDRIGDLVNELMLYFELPNINEVLGINVEENEYYWVNGIGNALIKYIDISIGGNIIDKSYGMWLNIWSELTISTTKKLAYNKMVGQLEGNTNINPYNNNSLKLYVPLFFWFCKNLGSSLPIIGLQNSEVRLNIILRDVNELIISKTGQYLDNNQVSQIHLIKGSLYTKYIFLEDNERKFFANQRLQYLVEQLQVIPNVLNCNGYTQNDQIVSVNKYEHLIPIDFNHPVKELFWVIQRPEAIMNVDSDGEYIPYGGNQWFNYTNEIYTVQNNINYKGLLKRGRLMFEGKERFDTLNSDFFNLIYPYYYHSGANNYNNYIYIYSFSEEPENFQPMGSCNFSRIDNKSFYVELDNNQIYNENPIITFFGINYNLLLIQGGLATIGYIN
jgi:hypothetical protein